MQTTPAAAGERFVEVRVDEPRKIGMHVSFQSQEDFTVGGDETVHDFRAFDAALFRRRDGVRAQRDAEDRECAHQRCVAGQGFHRGESRLS